MTECMFVVCYHVWKEANLKNITIYIYMLYNLKTNIFVSVYTHMFFYEFCLEVYKMFLEYFVNNIYVYI